MHFAHAHLQVLNIFEVKQVYLFILLRESSHIVKIHQTINVNAINLLVESWLNVYYQ